tara:strand:+ start:2606 stop:2959 length:354 start_codon:yes stop_codon:yes gene_type:complete
MKLILIVVLFFMGCDHTNVSDDSIRQYNNGLLEWEENRHSGRWTRLYENGKVRWQGNYVKGIDGLFCTSFYANGQVSLEEFYINGTRQGDCISYYKDGRVQKIETYNDGELLNSVYY